LAKRIIENRPYNSVEDLMKVKGIGKKKFEKLKDYFQP
jgi:competence protein ComEA